MFLNKQTEPQHFNALGAVEYGRTLAKAYEHARSATHTGEAVTNPDEPE